MYLADAWWDGRSELPEDSDGEVNRPHRENALVTARKCDCVPLSSALTVVYHDRQS
jgi:hypothetical protein